MRHQIPDGDVGKILARAVAVLHAQVRKRKFAETSPSRGRLNPRHRRTGLSRHIPAAIRRAVSERDGGSLRLVQRPTLRRAGVPRVRSRRGVGVQARALDRGHHPALPRAQSTTGAHRLRGSAHGALSATRTAASTGFKSSCVIWKPSAGVQRKLLLAYRPREARPLRRQLWPVRGSRDRAARRARGRGRRLRVRLDGRARRAAGSTGASVARAARDADGRPGGRSRLPRRGHAAPAAGNRDHHPAAAQPAGAGEGARQRGRGVGRVGCSSVVGVGLPDARSSTPSAFPSSRGARARARRSR